MTFQLADLPRLSRSTVERDEALRKDGRRLDELWTGGRVLLVDRKVRTPVAEAGTKLAMRSASDVAATRPAQASLLGVLDGAGYWLVPAPEPDGPALAPPNGWSVWPGALSADGEEWHDLRGVGALLDDTEAGLFTTAAALANWHARARFCARCGAPTTFGAAGWASTCTGCGREEYPRTDPAVICLVHDGADRVLLARQPIWPAGRFSVLAGFVEAGESLEACVRREILEEVGVVVDDVRYLGSQPWPFPRSIMIGFAAVGDPAAPVRPADGEIEQARWFTRDEVLTAMATEDSPDAAFVLPGQTSIARQMLAGWAS